MNVVLLDGNNTAHRAMATTILTHPQTGENVSVLYGVLQMIRANLKDLKPDLYVVCWDTAGGSDFRHRIYPEYKQHRYKDETEEADSKERRKSLNYQMDRLYVALRDFGIPQIRAQGFEADDIIARLTKLLSEHEIVIVSTDKDLYQLVNERVQIWNPVKSYYVHHKNFEQKAGISQDKFLDFKILQGDSSDNIPGIKGFGEVTAKKYLEQHGSIEEMTYALQNIPEKQRKVVEQRLLESDKQLELNRHLMDLNGYVTQPDVVEELDKAIAEEMDAGAELKIQKAKRFCIDNAFFSMLEKVGWFTPFFLHANKGEE